MKFIYPSKNLFVKFLVRFYGIADYCEFLPKQKDMGSFYSGIDCLLMPSIIEPYGMVATEALSMGVPVITGKHCGASDCIEDGKNGYTYDFSERKLDGLVECMRKIMSKGEEERMQMSMYCVESVKDYDIENFCKRYIELIEKLATGLRG